MGTNGFFLPAQGVWIFAVEMSNNNTGMTTKLAINNMGWNKVLTRVRKVVYLHCRNCDSLTVVAVAHFDLAGCHTSSIVRADDYFCGLQLWFVLLIVQNKVHFDPRSLKKLICS